MWGMLGECSCLHGLWFSRWQLDVSQARAKVCISWSSSSPLHPTCPEVVPLRQSSHSKLHDVIPSPNITIPPPADSAPANPTPSSDSEVHHISQTPVYCPEPDWPESNNSNAFTNAVSANPAPGRASIGIPNHPPTTRSRDSLNPTISNPLQTQHP